MTPYERALIRLKAFELLHGWANRSPTPDAKDIADRMPIPWGLKERMEHAAELVDWACRPASDQG